MSGKRSSLLPGTSIPPFFDAPPSCLTVLIRGFSPSGILNERMAEIRLLTCQVVVHGGTSCARRRVIAAQGNLGCCVRGVAENGGEDERVFHVVLLDCMISWLPSWLQLFDKPKKENGRSANTPIFLYRLMMVRPARTHLAKASWNANARCGILPMRPEETRFTIMPVSATASGSSATMTSAPAFSNARVRGRAETGMSVKIEIVVTEDSPDGSPGNRGLQNYVHRHRIFFNRRRLADQSRKRHSVHAPSPMPNA